MGRPNRRPDRIGVPVSLQSWVGVLVLVVWAIVPVTLGYLRYRHADL